MAKLIVSGREHLIADGETVASAATAAGLRPDSYLFLCDGTPVPMDSTVSPDSEVRALRVASGG
ncbi:MAG: hypothetical protein IJ026_00395 [Candidatus Methanomethylophilaceae archaeon]|nr:hypothetical protein [Candidatus Methanomethylophilaceae archaeon]